jgi:insulysin
VVLPVQTSMQQSFRSLSRLPLFYRHLCPTKVVPSCPRSSIFNTPRSTAPKVNITKRSFASVMTQVHRFTGDLEKPALDDRSYRVITLPNKLEALLVHDPETDKASASLNVNVGSFSDEDDMPGMAHAVEHALFMGTKKVCS